nr:FeoA family protein [Pirellula staleyi]
MHDFIPLEMLSAGQTARIAAICGDPDDTHRLEELGLRQGQLVEMVQPGIPCVLKLAGSKLCFRGGQLTGVLVELGDHL